MREARVKKIIEHSRKDSIKPLWEIYYDLYENDLFPACPIIWRTYAVDELDMWVKFKKWFTEQSKGDLTNVIWL